MNDIVLQYAGKGRYASSLIGGRFQVLESHVGNTYYIVDHSQPELRPAPGWLVAGIPVKDVRFYSKKDAEDVINRISGSG